MERERFQSYVTGLEQTMKNTHFDLRKVMEEFQELCVRVTPERVVPRGIVSDIRQTYKEIQDQLTKIRGVHQVLESKYRKHYRPDPFRDREIMRFAFLAKNLYSKFEYTLQEVEAKRIPRDRGECVGTTLHRAPFAWFQTSENQGILLKNLQGLYELDYETSSDSEYMQRRVGIRSEKRSVSLFVLSGETTLIDHLQSRMRLREYDIKERSLGNELRGALTHLKEVSPSEVERVIKRFTDSSDLSRMKCLLLPVQSHKDLEKEGLGLAENILRGMDQGEVKTLLL